MAAELEGRLTEKPDVVLA